MKFSDGDAALWRNRGFAVGPVDDVSDFANFTGRMTINVFSGGTPNVVVRLPDGALLWATLDVVNNTAEETAVMQLKLQTGID
jgi:hypothetical protein